MRPNQFEFHDSATKKDYVVHLEEYKIIILGNFLVKIIWKVIATKLDNILNKILSLNQFGFVKGEQTQSTIAIISKIINNSNKKI